MSELIIQSGKLQGKRLVLPPKEMLVGRDEDCDLRISSSLVSRKHCKLKVTSEGILVTDLGSQNGTQINDVPIIEPTLLREGDILRIGSTLLAVPSINRPKGIMMNAHAKVSDDEIADWLTDSGSSSPGSDTAVIPNPAPPRPAPTPTPTPVAPIVTTAAISPPAKPQISKVLTVKDEAAIVIRNHWESVKAKKKNS